MDVLKKTTYEISLSTVEVRDLMGIVTTGVKNSPPTGYDMKKAAPIIEKLKKFLAAFGKDVVESEGEDSLIELTA